jgi:hypothetical protein
LALKTRPPAVRKGHPLPFPVAITAWVDLLGYGSLISDADFNPLHPKASEAIRRLRAFHDVVASYSARVFRTFVMNDGAVAYRDLSYRSASVTADFVARSWDLFQAINDQEGSGGYPGARMVIATGFRAKGRRSAHSISAPILAGLLSQIAEGNMSVEEALRAATRYLPESNIAPQLQANFAFTKSYVAESSGSAAGLRGSQCFLDMALLDSPPTWLSLGESIAWSHPRLKLSATFSPIVNVGRSRRGSDGFRDAVQVAQALAGDPDVLKALRKARTTSALTEDGARRL